MDQQDEKVKKSLNYSVKDASAYSVMAGFGDQYVSAFAIALKATTTQIGLLASVPNLISSITQVFSVKLVNKLKNRKKVINISVFFHAIMWLAILLIPFIFKSHQVLILIAFVTLYFVFGTFASPAWISLMGDLVPEKHRGDYFGKRNRIAGFIALVSIFVAGFLLEKLTTIQMLSVPAVLTAFGALFLIAMIARFISLYYLAKMYEPPYKPEEEGEYFSILDFIKSMSTRNFSIFTLYICLTTFAVQVAGPYFAVYMLRDLKFSYWTYAIVTGTAAAASFISMGYWGDIIDKYGSRKVFSFTSYIIITLPILWIFSPNIYWLIFIQILSGLSWAGFQLATSNFLYDACTPQKRARVFAYYSALNGVAFFLGAMTGALLLFVLPEHFIFAYTVLFIFLISGILRLIFQVVFIQRIKEVRKVAPISDKTLLLSIVELRPLHGLVFRLWNWFKRKNN